MGGIVGMGVACPAVATAGAGWTPARAEAASVRFTTTRPMARWADPPELLAPVCWWAGAPRPWRPPSARTAATANASAIPRTFSRLMATTFQPPYKPDVFRVDLQDKPSFELWKFDAAKTGVAAARPHPATRVEVSRPPAATPGIQRSVGRVGGSAAGAGPSTSADGQPGDEGCCDRRGPGQGVRQAVSASRL